MSVIFIRVLLAVAWTRPLSAPVSLRFADAVSAKTASVGLIRSDGWQSRVAILQHSKQPLTGTWPPISYFERVGECCVRGGMALVSCMRPRLKGAPP